MTKVTCLLQVFALALALSSGVAHADAGKTRPEVQAEFLMAVQAGELPSGFVAKSARELYWGYAKPTDVRGGVQVQARVRDELIAAEQAGEIRMSFLGRTKQELSPGNYAPATPGASRSRASVRAELAAARAAGELPVGFAVRPLRTIYPGQYPMTETTRDRANTGSDVSMNEPQ